MVSSEKRGWSLGNTGARTETGGLSTDREIRFTIRVPAKGGLAMKWGGCDNRAGERLSRICEKLLGKKGLYYLMMIVALGLVLGANVKWSPP